MQRNMGAKEMGSHTFRKASAMENLPSPRRVTVYLQPSNLSDG
jgi:hypothetical protein